MPTFLQSLGWSSATYSSWSYRWKTPLGSENRCPLNTLHWSLAAFKQTCGADQDRHIPPCQGPTSQRDRHFLYAPLQPLSSLGFLQTLMLSQETFPASCHLSGYVCWMFRSHFSLYTLLEPPEAPFDKLQVGPKNTTVFQISNWLLAKFTSGFIFYGVFTVIIIFF